MLRAFIPTFLLLAFATLGNLQAQGFINFVNDTVADGANPNLPAGVYAGYSHDTLSDSLFFYIQYEAGSFDPADFGVNILYNLPGGNDTANWADWTPPATVDFVYNRALTAWVTGSAPNTYTGEEGISTASALNANPPQVNSLGVAGFSYEVDSSISSVIVGLPREWFVPDSLLTSDTTYIDAIVALGSSTTWNDDLADNRAPIALVQPDTATTSLRELQAGRISFSAYPVPAQEVLTVALEPTSTPTTLGLYTRLGKRIVQRRILNQDRVQLPLADLPRGVYFLRLQRGGQQGLRRIVLE